MNNGAILPCKENVRGFQKKFHRLFSDEALLERALTRRAYAKERSDVGKACGDQEAYRVLGDAVLGAVVVDNLIEEGHDTGGEITKRRKEYESREALSKLAKRLGIWDFICTNRGENKKGAEKQPYVLAETLEAIIGAVYLDKGGDLRKVKEIVIQWFEAEKSTV